MVQEAGPGAGKEQARQAGSKPLPEGEGEARRGAQAARRLFERPQRSDEVVLEPVARLGDVVEIWGELWDCVQADNAGEVVVVQRAEPHVRLRLPPGRFDE